MNHVVYCDNFFISGPLVDMLVKDQIFLTGSVKKKALVFPTSLKTVTPPKGIYISASVGGVQYFVFNDRKEVCFVTNVFPESMNGKVYRLQHDGLLREQYPPPPPPPPPLPVYD